MPAEGCDRLGPDGLADSLPERGLARDRPLGPVENRSTSAFTVPVQVSEFTFLSLDDCLPFIFV